MTPTKISIFPAKNINETTKPTKKINETRQKKYVVSL